MMVKISDLEKISNNLEKLEYKIYSKIPEMFIFRKEGSRFDIDLETHEVRFYKKFQTQNKFKHCKTYSFSEFAVISGDWIKKNLKGE